MIGGGVRIVVVAVAVANRTAIVGPGFTICTRVDSVDIAALAVVRTTSVGARLSVAIVATQNFTVRSSAGIRIAPIVLVIAFARTSIAMRLAFGVIVPATLVSSAVLSVRIGRIRQLALARTPVPTVHARRGAVRIAALRAAPVRMRAHVDARRIAHIVRTRGVAIGFGRTRPVFGPSGLGHGNLLCD
ncbi:hypothetical protein [Burkholderia oklahomensis]|uniref:hypothetical protein n=1 Tax=Burkholderia oklahomensis TaxID=342113 RepID=UPI0005D9B645|nr:hypothetical protein [Burkholderia oklahomensis]AJX32795.1 hypothetical protein BG90_1633 [Burkholderia oklahomensis C6786]SUW58775.1 Uncharacterised protein [Burkholderia oklahomensis]